MRLTWPLIAIAFLVLTGRFDTAGAQTFSTLYTFGSVTNGSTILDGSGPNWLVAGRDGNLYGTTDGGGTSGAGTAFKITPQGTLTVLYNFCNSGQCPNHLGNPKGIVEAADGNFYGTTLHGGTNNEGAVFKLTSQGTVTVLHSFCGVTDASNDCLDGYQPLTPLIQASDGNFYGTTQYGGSNGWGTVFEITSQGTLTTLYGFSAGVDGRQPSTPLIQGSDSNFYGTIDFAGSPNDGIVYQLTSAGTFSILYSFCTSTNPVGPCADGSGPLASPIEVGGILYGSTRDGGLAAQLGLMAGGEIFAMPLDGLPSGSLVPLYNFCNAGSCSANGFDPSGALVYGSDSNFYGLATEGGAYGGGTVFQLTPDGTPTTLHSFCTDTNSSGNCTDGNLRANSVTAPMIQANDGKFYGVTGQGGAHGHGTVFKLDMGLAGTGSGGNCSYSINPTNAAFGAAGGSDTVSVLASNGCAWTATNNDSFITITSGSSGSGNGTVHYTVAANTSTNEQIGTMTIAGETFTVTEAGTTSGGECTFTLSPTSVTLTAKGGSKNVSVKVKDKTCAWTAVSNDPFITITSGSSGTGPGKVVFSVPGNTNTTALMGTMTIAGQTVTVNQALGGCTFKLGPKAGKLKSTGGTATINVTPNLSDCEWTATTTDSFITIVSGSGMGKGKVTYSVPANSTTNILTGSITVGGQTFSITQAGVK
ncbi:MAG TPA: choice-of-anchor tandem repeat GloVer-containing protein [Verrucomicrobiae bacterium]|nr:choice-of-anchor tandem repeat GloVer-containing protein [Verrucomicrobiae bacterium]